MENPVRSRNASALSVLIGIFLFTATVPGALTPILVKDINTNTESAFASASRWPVLDGVAYFSATDADHGRELWRSDGTSEGTWMVKDILPEFENSSPGYFVIWSNALWFTAYVASNEKAVLKTDGTANGTVIVQRGFFGAPNDPLGQLTLVSNTLFFSGKSETNGMELWKSDGTPEGTVMLGINPGAASSSPSYLTPLNGRLLFNAFDTNGSELWISDGTPVGTSLLKDIRAGTNSSGPNVFTVVSNQLFFTANDGVNGSELWVTDGTSNGTHLVLNIGTGSTSGGIGFPSAVAGRLFFQAGGNAGTELWQSDGTSNGTFRVADISPGINSSYPSYIVDLDGIALFAASSGSGQELWRSDGTSNGTWRVTNTNGAPVMSPYWLFRVGNVVYFSGGGSAASSTPTGTELWRTDGTSNGTFMVKDIVPGSYSAFPQLTATLDSFSLLIASTPENGTELWRTDGTSEGTMLVKDINVRTGGSFPGGVAASGTNVLFSNSSGLWKADGTFDGTEQISTVQVLMQTPGAAPLYSGLAGVSNLVVFPAMDTNGMELWVSDGTSNGTHLLKDIYPGPYGSYPQSLTLANGLILFTALGTNGTELWRTDGTEAGTREVQNIRPGTVGSSPRALIAFAERLFFWAQHDTNRAGLWATDGTPAGARLVADFTNATFWAMSASATRLFFLVMRSGNGELWTCDGAPETTHFVASVPIQLAANYKAIALSGSGNIAVFAAGTTGTGVELWHSDGTPGGTSLLKDIRPGTAGSFPHAFFQAINAIYFYASDDVHGTEVWRTDGTEQGTRPLKDINPGTASSEVYVAQPRMAEVNSLTFFLAYEPAHGIELWMTDGSDEGTALVSDLYPSTQNTGVTRERFLKGIGDRLYFSATDAVSGEELWMLRVPPPPRLQLESAQGTVLISTIGDPGQPRVIELTSDFVTWTALETNVADAQGLLRFTNSVVETNLFFRVRGVVSP